MVRSDIFNGGIRSRVGSSPAAPGPRGKKVAAVIALLAGLLCIAYPFVSNAVHQGEQRVVVEQSREIVSETDDGLLDSERQHAIAYNEQLLSSRAVVTDPFDPDAEKPTDEDYESVLNLAGDGVMATINIPKIHVELPIYHGTEADTLQRGVGHLEQTSVPIGGESTHCVLSGHTGLPTMKIFDNLDQLEVGDYFVISVLGEDHAYEVTSVEVVLPDETDSLVIEQGRDLCTLVTCTPYGINSHRLLVHAHAIPYTAEMEDEVGKPGGFINIPLPYLLLIIALVVIAMALAVLRLRVSRRAATGAVAGATRRGDGASGNTGSRRTHGKDGTGGRHFS